MNVGESDQKVEVKEKRSQTTNINKCVNFMDKF